MANVNGKPPEILPNKTPTAERDVREFIKFAHEQRRVIILDLTKFVKQATDDNCLACAIFATGSAAKLLIDLLNEHNAQHK